MFRPINGFAEGGRVYAFGPFRLDAGQRLLFHDGRHVPLTGKAFDILLVLVEARGRLVEKDHLMQAVWADTFVEESNLTFNIHQLRKALKDPTANPVYIENLPRRGYRLLAEVREVVPAPIPANEPGPDAGLAAGAVAKAVAADTTPAEAPVAAESTVVPPPPVRAGVARRRIGVAVLVAGLLLVFAIGVRLVRGPIFKSAEAISVVPLTSYPGSVRMPAFSPDGERIAFAWTGAPGRGVTWDIYVKAIGQEPALQLTRDPGEDNCPTWSPDGRQIAFLREKDRSVAIYVVSALGGPERKLVDVNYGRYFDLEWSPDGTLLVFAEKTSPGVPYDSLVSTALFAISVETLEKRQLTFPTGGGSDHRFAFSRDGKTLAFLRHDAGAGVGILLLPLDGGEPRTIHVEPAWTGQLAWTADGRSLIFTSQRSGGNKLFRIAAAGGTPELLPVAEDWAFSPAVSRRGNRLVYVREYNDTDLWRVELEHPHGPGKPPVVVSSSARVDLGPEFSPDGRRIAFMSDRTGKTELWVADRDGGVVTPLTDFHAWSPVGPSWSPDGRHLAFYSINGIRGSPGGLFMLDVESRQVRRLAGDSTRFRNPRWSRNGRWIYAASGRTGQETEIWRFPAAGGSPVQITTRGGAIAEESLDGDDLYFQKTFTDGIWRLPTSGGEETLVLPEFSAQMYANWRVAAEGLYYIDPRTRPFGSVEFFEFTTRRSHRISLLTSAPTMWSGSMAVSPDGKWIIYPQMSRSASEIILVENFR